MHNIYYVPVVLGIVGVLPWLIWIATFKETSNISIWETILHSHNPDFQEDHPINHQHVTFPKYLPLFPLTFSNYTYLDFLGISGKVHPIDDNES